MQVWGPSVACIFSGTVAGVDDEVLMTHTRDETYTTRSGEQMF